MTGLLYCSALRGRLCFLRVCRLCNAAAIRSIILAHRGTCALPFALLLRLVKGGCMQTVDVVSPSKLMRVEGSWSVVHRGVQTNNQARKKSVLGRQYRTRFGGSMLHLWMNLLRRVYRYNNRRARNSRVERRQIAKTVLRFLWIISAAVSGQSEVQDMSRFFDCASQTRSFMCNAAFFVSWSALASAFWKQDWLAEQDLHRSEAMLKQLNARRRL
jgi:hypothetical protein